MTDPLPRHKWQDQDRMEERRLRRRRQLLNGLTHVLPEERGWWDDAQNWRGGKWTWGHPGCAILGVDPGKRGYIVQLLTSPAPQLDLYGLRAWPLAGFLDTKHRWDVPLLLDHVGQLQATVAVVERQWARPQCGSRTAFENGLGYGVVLTALISLRVPLFAPSPVHWQVHTSDQMPGPDAKQRAMLFCNTHRPGLLPLVMKSYQDGAADAYCLAVYGLQQLRAGRNVHTTEEAP